MEKWIFVNNITSLDKLYILTKEVNDNYVTQDNHASILMNALNKNGASRTEANNHPINYILFYKMVYLNVDKFELTSFGKFLIDNYYKIKSDKKLCSEFFFSIMYDIKYPNSAVDTSENYNVYPFRIIFKLLMDNKIDKKMTIQEFEELLSTVHRDSDYDLIINLIVKCRNSNDIDVDCEKIAQASTVIAGWCNQFNVLKKEGEFIMISNELSMLLPKINENCANFNNPYNNEFKKYVITKYLFDGLSMSSIENSFYNADDRRGFLARDVLEYYGINDETNKSIYFNKDSETVKKFLLLQDDARYRNIANLLFDNKEEPIKQIVEFYTKDNFLEEVFISNEKYDSIVSLLKKKQNIILEGAPGVGKTFMAKRLAYSILGSKDNDKIEFIQFHQNYSYEDFIEGFKPTEKSFELKKGLFYNFCKKAEADEDNNYYLIIDEINRGNLSKIFGELLMLIESDKRGEKITLAYSEEKFTVPKNVFIIGLMNTADRSLALIDYALRRRFSFIRIEPAFENDKFKKAFEAKFDEDFSNVINIIKNINKAIEDDKSLGNGFKIGHSYFCPNLKDRLGNKKDIQDIITYEILPLLEEYWYDDEDSLIQWENALNGVIND